MKPASLALAAMFGLSLGSPAPQTAMSDAEIVRQVLPSVVNLTVWKSGAGNPASARRAEEFYGSGFVFDASGLILTNRHVVSGAASITVTFSDGTRANASLCAASGLIDLAVIKVQGKGNLHAVNWADSEKLGVGDRVLAIGNPLGVGISVSGGIVSALHRHVSANPFDDFIQTDAAINHGNSGGMLVDATGQVVGVNTAFLSDHANGGSLGVGFAIPASEAVHAVEGLKDCSNRSPGWIGVTVQQVTPDLAQAMGLPQPTGSIVTTIAPDSPAQQAGLQEGDVLESINGQAAPTPLLAMGQIASAQVGSPLRIEYLRNGQLAQAQMTVAGWPGLDTGTAHASARMDVSAAASRSGLGVSFTDRANGLGSDSVVVAHVDPGSPASDAGLREGDIVLRVGQQAPSSADLVQTALRQADQAGRHTVPLLVESGSKRRWVALALIG